MGFFSHRRSKVFQRIDNFVAKYDFLFFFEECNISVLILIFFLLKGYCYTRTIWCCVILLNHFSLHNMGTTSTGFSFAYVY